MEKLKKNIAVMLQYSDAVYLLFNSPAISGLRFDKRIIFIENKSNIGLSKAINIGINKAKKDGHKYAVLFDQDSCLEQGDFECLFSAMKKWEKMIKIACIGPSLRVYNNTIPIPMWSKSKIGVLSDNLYFVNNIITSGMLVDIDCFVDVNGFNEDYPVDFCDYVFCWKCVYKGYRVLQSRDAYLIHEIGESSLKLFSYIIHFHAPYRNYFLVRDTLNICLKQEETPFYIRLRFLFLLLFRMVFFIIALDKRHIRFKMYLLGLKDFILNKRGFGSIAKILK